MSSASASHRRGEPSTSVNRKVTTPAGGTPVATRKGCHTKPCSGRYSQPTFETLVTRLSCNSTGSPGSACTPSTSASKLSSACCERLDGDDFAYLFDFKH